VTHAVLWNGYGAKPDVAHLACLAPLLQRSGWRNLMIMWQCVSLLVTSMSEAATAFGTQNGRLLIWLRHCSQSGVLGKSMLRLLWVCFHGILHVFSQHRGHGWVEDEKWLSLLTQAGWANSDMCNILSYNPPDSSPMTPPSPVPG